MNLHYTPETITIPLTKGQFATVDIADADLALFKWQARYAKDYADGGKYIARRTIYTPKSVTILMNRAVYSRMIGRELLRSEKIDHINGNPLDNRRENLRLVTNSQNAMNRGATKNNKSGFKGVSWKTSCQKWVAQIQTEGKKEHLGLFDTPEEAYKAYCEAALRQHGKHARLA